jgi:AIPR protein
VSLALTQLTRSLQTRFIPHIEVSDLSATKQADPACPELYSRALAAAAVATLGEVDDRVAAHAVVDGSDDRGIDAVLVDTAHNALLLVQSKWSKDGRGGIAKGDTLKFIDGCREMMDFDWAVFNARLRSKSAIIEQVLMDSNVKVVLCIVTSSDTTLSSDAGRSIKKFLEDINTPGLPEMVSLKHVTLSEVHSAISGGRAVDLEATLENWGPIGEPYSAQYGVINAADLAEWYERHGERLFEANIRQPLGRTVANDAIRETLLKSPEEFWYLNNGVTVLAESVAKVTRGAASRNQGFFKLTKGRLCGQRCTDGLDNLCGPRYERRGGVSGQGCDPVHLAGGLPARLRWQGHEGNQHAERRGES